VRKLTEWVLAHKLLVVVAWVLLLLAGGAASGPATERLVVDFGLPGKPSFETAKQIQKTYGNGGFDPYVLTIHDEGGVDEKTAAAAFTRMQAELPQMRIVSRASSGDPSFTTPDGKTAWAYAYYPFPQSFTELPSAPLKEAAEGLSTQELAIQVTGLGELSVNEDEEQGSLLVEVLIGGGLALAVLVFVFASFLALVPLVIAAFSILTTFLVVWGLTYVSDVSFVVQFLIAFIGLGVAIDYSLIVVTRWREERDHGKTPHQAVVDTMATAGSAVVFSGVTVAIGLLALLVVNVPLVRSMGYGGALIPLISIAATLTLLPVILEKVGSRVDWPKVRHEDKASRGWSAWARLVVRRRWVAAGAGALALLLLAAPVLSIKTGTAESESLSRGGVAFDAYADLRDGGLPAGLLTPMEVLTTPAAADDVAADLREVDGVLAAYEAGGASVKGDSSVVIVVPEEEQANSDTADVVEAVLAAADRPEVVGVSGTGPVQLDYTDAVYKKFPLVLLVIVVLTFVLLARAFRSVLLPLKAVVLNLISLAATFGGLVWFWQMGNGSDELFDISATGAITFWIPILLFAFLYGLSMDYEVFILARMREEYDAGAGTDGAAIEGIGRTGRLVTSAALILFGAFTALFFSGSNTDLKLLSSGLAFGILLDATIVRALIVPALVSLFGKWNWWLPEGFAKVLRVEPSLPHAEPARVPAVVD
jgi:putative drug exporter of the RND superfamily